MQRILTWWLSLEHIEPGPGAELSLDWQEPLDPWVWFLLVVLVPCYVVLVYRADGGRRSLRGLMAALRCLVILLAIALLCQPVVVLRRDRVEPSTVAVMLDQSLSMARVDPTVGGRQPTADATERWAAAVAALGSDGGAMLGRLLEHHELRLFRFAEALSAAEELSEPSAVAGVLQQLARARPDGRSTHIAGSIKQVFDACVDAHLTAVVLLSDGQPTDDEGWGQVADLCRARGTPVHVIPLGSPDPPQDLAVESCQADALVYLGDTVAVRVRHRHTGMDPQTPYVVRLRQPDNSVPLAEQEQQAGSEDATRAAELRFAPTRLGVMELIVEIPPYPDESDPHNNQQRLQITVVDDKIRVLYVDGYPRYEYRYLKNTLLREPTLVSSVLLLSADERFVQEGNQPIRRFPGSAEELAEYDVILMGDVDPRAGWLSDGQMEQIVDFVGREGGGFGMIAGQTYTPLRFAGTPLERLLPIDLGQSDPGGFSGPPAAFRPRPTPVGQDHALLRLLPDEQHAREVWARLPAWYWCFGAARRAAVAEVLLEHPTQTVAGSPIPLAVIGRYGAGEVFYQGSDDSWRWRRHHGEALFDTYWVQVVRFLGHRKRLEERRAVVLRVQPQEVEPQETLTLSMELADVDLARQLPDRIDLAVRRADGTAVSETTLVRAAAESQIFQGLLVAGEAGQFEVAYGGEPPDVPPATALFRVRRQSLEEVRPQANPALLAELARLTGGDVIQPREAATLPEHISDRRYVVPDDVVETIWDSRMALALFALLIVGEWLLRQLSGLP